MNDSEAHRAAGQNTPRACRLLTGLLAATLACSRPQAPLPANPVFTISMVAVDPGRDVLVIEIENRSDRPLHFPEPERWNFANLIKVGFRAFQPVIPTAAPRLVTTAQPNRDGDMMQVHWVLPAEEELDIPPRSRERRTFQVPAQIGGGRYSLGLVVVGRAQSRWLTVEEPVFGPRRANLPGPVRWLATVIFGCLLAAFAALASLLWPFGKKEST